jgi:MFS family permease
LYVQAVLSGTPYQAGSAIAPIAIGWPISSTLAGRLLPRLGYRFLIRLGLAVTFLAAGALSLLLRPDADLWVIRLVMLVYGLGLGLANTPLIIAVQSSVPWDRRGVATAVTLSSRTIGGTLAVGTLGSVLSAAIAAQGAPMEIADKVLGAGRAAIPPSMAEGILGALRGGMGTIFHAVAAISVAGFLVSRLCPAVRISPRGSDTSG